MFRRGVTAETLSYRKLAGRGRLDLEERHHVGCRMSVAEGLSLLLVSLLFATTYAGAADLKTRNIVLITTDGLRRQEVFTGLSSDNQQEAGVSRMKRGSRRGSGARRRKSRAALMPFFSVPRSLVMGRSMETG